MATYDTFMALRDFVKGKISKYDLQDSDPSITNVKENKSNLGQTKIVLSFPGDDRVFGMMGLSDDDIWFYNMINSYYSDYEFIDYHQVKDDFRDGYIIYGELDEENLEKLKMISQFVYPAKFDLTNESFRKNFSEKLFELFNRETEDILSDYLSEKNSEMSKVADKKINEDMNRYFEELDFTLSNSETLEIPVANLIMWYIRTNSVHLPLSELLEKVFEENKADTIGGWAENSYEYQDDEYFDSESFNSYVGRKFDEILEKIEDGAEGEFDFREYKEMVERVSKKFEADKWYKLPKKKDVDFKIDGYEMNPNKIVVKLRRGMKARQMKLTEENFYHLLYQPTLFNLEEI
jgi:hypothetical protein